MGLSLNLSKPQFSICMMAIMTCALLIFLSCFQARKGCGSKINAEITMLCLSRLLPLSPEPEPGRYGERGAREGKRRGRKRTYYLESADCGVPSFPQQAEHE